MSNRRPCLVILGATGALGNGLAFRWAKAGYPIIIGSRVAEKAQKSAADLNQLSGLNSVRGMDNRNAAAAGDIVVLTVPFSNQRGILESVQSELQGKILVDATVPLIPPQSANSATSRRRVSSQGLPRILGRRSAGSISISKYCG